MWILIPGAHTLFEPGEAGVARANPHSNPVVPYYAAGRDPSWYLADGPPNCSYTVVGSLVSGVVAETVFTPL